jgi:hypothetical protein
MVNDPRDQSTSRESIAEVARAAGERTQESRNQIAEQVRSVGSAVRKATAELRQTNPLGIADGVERLGEGIERMSEYLRDRSPREIKEGLEGYARREPGQFLGGAFLLGLVAARFLKSSTASREDERKGGPEPETAGGLPASWEVAHGAPY